MYIGLKSLQIVVSVTFFVTLFVSLGLGGSVNTNHMSMQTVLTVKLFVTLFENMGMGGSTSIDHMKMQTVLTVKLIITILVILRVGVLFSNAGSPDTSY